MKWRKIMPIYEYKCDLCNGMWEEIQKFSDDPLTVCKSCEKEGGTHKIVSGGIAFVLKGGGWYKDSYSSSDASTSGYHSFQDQIKDHHNKHGVESLKPMTDDMVTINPDKNDK